MRESTTLASKEPIGLERNVAAGRGGQFGVKFEVSRQSPAVWDFLVEAGIVAVAFHFLGQRQVDLAGVFLHQLLPADAAGDIGETDVVVSGVGFQSQDVRVLGDVRADEEAVVGPLETDVFEAEFKAGDLAGVDIAQQPGVGIAAVVALLA